MKKAELIEILESLNFFPGKQLGQNFMIDGNFLEYIIREAAPKPGEPILEVGPGFGALTRGLIAAGADVTAIEYDRRICEYLRNNLKEPNFRLVEGDASRVDIQEIMGEGTSFRCIANLPYSISSIFIAKMLDFAKPPTEMIVLLQKEMGQRLAAVPSTKNYGALSVRTQMVYDVELMRIVPPKIFMPPPDIDSALVRFSLKDNIPPQDLRKELDRLVKAAFSQRRKKMIKAVSRIYARDKIDAAFEELGISQDIRAEKLDLETYLNLTKLLSSKKDA